MENLNYELDELIVKKPENFISSYDSIDDCFNTIINDDANYLDISSTSCIEFKVKNVHEPPSIENVLKVLEKFDQKKFLFLFRSTCGKSFTFYWHLNKAKRLLCLNFEADEEMFNFVKKFLNESFNGKTSGLHKSFKTDGHNLIVNIDLFSLGDEKDFNLLFIAVEQNNENAVKSLMNFGFNISFLIDGQIPADLAYEKGNFDVLLILLKANSRFPVKFASQEYPDNLKEFLKTSTNIRKAVMDENFDKIEKILNENQNLKYFFDEENASILTFAIRYKRIEIYLKLVRKNVFFGPREDLDAIMETLDENEQKMLHQTHLKSSQKLFENHLMILMANSSVSGDDSEAQNRKNHVCQAFVNLNEIKSAKVILKAVAAKKDFDIYFDFNRDTVSYLDPSQSGSNGLFLTSGRILIAAKGLLDPSTKNEVYGVLIHELSHFAMCLAFENDAKPYHKKDEITASAFKEICDNTKLISENNSIVKAVFEFYDDELHHAELIVRSPHMIVQYQESDGELNESLKNFESLHDFYKNITIPKIQAEIPRIAREADKAYQKALRKISKLKKIIYFLIGLMIVGIPLLIWILYEPIYTWKGLDKEDQVKILNSEVRYRGLDIRFNQLIRNDSEVFEFLKSDQIKGALDGDFSKLNRALNSNLDQYIFLSPENLTTVFWDKLLYSSVDFQGKTILLSELSTNISSLSSFSSNQIKDLLNNRTLSIGEHPEGISFFISRKFYERTDEDLDEESIKNSSITLSDVYEFVESSKLFLLADGPGSGKSVVFKHMSSELKKIYPDRWIEYVELKHHANAFKLIQEKEFSDLSEVEFISSSILKLDKLERDLFIECFRTDKVIIFWDAVDEISPYHDETFLVLAKNIHGRTNNSQFISTRLQHASKLSNTFGQSFLSLIPYSKQDRLDYVNNFLNSSNLTQDDVKKTVEKVESFIESVLEKESNLFKRDINNPLLIRMITEIAISKDLSTEMENIYKVFDEFVNMKLDQFDKKGKVPRKFVQSVSREVSIDELHTIYALKAIFPDTIDNYLTKKRVSLDILGILNQEVHWNDTQVSTYGIMVRKDSSEVEFVHRTFAEFFVAKYFIEYIYELNNKNPPQLDEMSSRIVLFHNVAYNIEIYKVIHEYIKNFLNDDHNTSKEFPDVVLDVFKKNFGTFQDYFMLNRDAPLFVRFFEKDERVMKILARVDKYDKIEVWLETEIGIGLGGKSSYIDNNQLGLILMKSWEFEKNGNKVFANFIRGTTNLTQENLKSSGLDPQNVNKERNFTLMVEKLSELNSTSKFLNSSQEFLTNDERKEIFKNSVFAINEDLKDKNESKYFIERFIETLNYEEIREALLKKDLKRETFFYKTLGIDNFDLNSLMLNLTQKHLTKEQFYKSLIQEEIIFGSTIPMLAASHQDYPFFTYFIEFIQNLTTEDQFKEILLQRDYENDTMLQYAENYEYRDNFVWVLMDVYNATLSLKEIQKTFIERSRGKLPSFAGHVQSRSSDVLDAIATGLGIIFKNDNEDLVEYLSRRDENGNTVFSIFKDQKKFRDKLSPFAGFLTLEELKKVLYKI